MYPTLTIVANTVTPDVAPLFFHRNLLPYIEGGAKSK
jgi:hypothetical protein